MSKIKLYRHQEEAISKLSSGKMLVGKVGSGKTLTALSFYFKHFAKLPLYVITTAKKRDSHDWEDEASMVGINNIFVDSWNNISKYKQVKGAFFIFDEQKVTGYGEWARTYIKIAKENKWILLTGTPGDEWLKYMAVFIANGFYRNRRDFEESHVVYDPFVKFKKVKFYFNEAKLKRYRNQIVVTMDTDKFEEVQRAKRIKHRIYAEYDKTLYSMVVDKRWNPYTNKPIMNCSELVQLCRKVVGRSEHRISELEKLLSIIDKVIIFYNYDYELDIIENVCLRLHIPYTQWNGHKHEERLSGDRWVYIVHCASAEAWNCIETNAIIFYSSNYSYSVMEQAEGRIDRLNTPYSELHYYYLDSRSSIERSIDKAIRRKGKFNENTWKKI